MQCTLWSACTPTPAPTALRVVNSQPPRLQTLALFFQFSSSDTIVSRPGSPRQRMPSVPPPPHQPHCGQGGLSSCFLAETVQSPALLSWSDSHCTLTCPRVMPRINFLIACSNKVWPEIQALPGASLTLLPHRPCFGCWQGQALCAPCLSLSPCPGSACNQS